MILGGSLCYDREVGRISQRPSPAASGESALIAARVVRIENYEDEIIVHLDNGQVWQQVEEAQADANLRPGDAVTIVRSSGSYWLSGRNGAALKVRRKQLEFARDLKSLGSDPLILIIEQRARWIPGTEEHNLVRMQIIGTTLCASCAVTAAAYADDTDVGGVMWFDFGHINLQNENAAGIPVETPPSGWGLDVKRLYFVVDSQIHG